MRHKRIKPSNYIVELYRIVLMDGEPLKEIALKMLEYASGNLLLFPFEADKQLAFFIFKYYNGDFSKLLQ